MIDFFNELYALFAADTGGGFYTAVNGRFSYGKALAQSQAPYAVFFGVTNSPEDTFTEELDELTFQVNAYSNGTYKDAAQIVKYCRDLFDGAVVTVNGYEIEIQREQQVPPWLDGELWVASIVFTVIIEEV